MLPITTGSSRHFSFHALLFIVVYFAAEAFLINAVSLGAGLDDAELISNLSFWNWGYGGSQPPLYTWITYGVTKLSGLHFIILQLLKCAVLCSTFLAVYAGLRLLEVRPVVAACAMLSVFLLPQISWESQRALIHSVMGTAGSAWCFAAFAWFVQKRSVAAALCFGLSIAAAVLGKYNGGLFVLSLLAAALMMKQTRSLLKTWKFALSLAVAMLAMTPALVFMALHPGGIVQRADKFHAGLSGHPFGDRLTGMLDLAVTAVAFTLPAVAVAGIIVLLGRKNRQSGNDCPAPWAERFLAAVLISGLALFAAVIIVSGATNIKDRWLQPVLFLAAPFLALLLARFDTGLRACRAYGFTGLAAALLVPVALYLNLQGWPDRNNLPEQNIDYPALEKILKAEGPVATVLSADALIPGNLRLLDPSIKTLFAETPFADARLARPLAIVWDGQEKLPDRLVPVLSRAGIDPGRWPVRPVDLTYRRAEDVVKRVYYLYIP